MYGCAGLCCCMWAFSSCREGDPLQPCADFSLRLLLLQKLEAVVPVLSCLSECGILPAQGSNPCPLCMGRQTFFFPFIFISWRLITLQYYSGFCHRLTWISHGFTCVPHPEPSSHLPPPPIPLGHPSAPAPSTCLMHPTWTGDLFHTW